MAQKGPSWSSDSLGSTLPFWLFVGVVYVFAAAVKVIFGSLGWWLLIPLGVLVVMLAVWKVRKYSRSLKHQQDAALRQAEWAARVGELGKNGASVVRQAQDAVERLLASEAARTGWLGDPGELDFDADLAMIYRNVKGKSPGVVEIG